METKWVRTRLLSDEKLNLEGDVPQTEVVTKADHEAALKDAYKEFKSAADSYDGLLEDYNTLLDQAIRFAEWIQACNVLTPEQRSLAARFLHRPDVQARRKEQG